MTPDEERLQVISASIRAAADAFAPVRNDSELDDMLEKADNLICMAIDHVRKFPRN